MHKLRKYFYLCIMEKEKKKKTYENQVVVSCRMPEQIRTALIAYIKRQKKKGATQDATAANFLIRVVRDNLIQYGVLDVKNRVQGNWLDSEAFERKDKRRHTTTASKGATFGVGLNLKYHNDLFIALNNFTGSGFCPDGLSRSECLCDWITKELFLLGELRSITSQPVEWEFKVSKPRKKVAA